MLECNAIQALKRITDSDIYGLEYDDCEDRKVVSEYIKTIMCDDYISCISPVYCDDSSNPCVMVLTPEGEAQPSCNIVLEQIYETVFV